LQLLSRLLRHLEKADAGAGQRAVLERVFAGIAAEVAADHAAEVRGASLDERIAEASIALEREGIVDGWTKEGDVFQIVNGECPYLRLAEMSNAPCRADQQSIELLLHAQVEQTKRIVDGSPVCEYIVRPNAIDSETGMQGAEPLPGNARGASSPVMSSPAKQSEVA
jgi:predicted ArsR family transcriptional regulator